jgi:hypothetical protein
MNSPLTHSFFSTNFPNGLMIGQTGRSIKLTTPQAVRNFLPNSGTPARLTGDKTNPNNKQVKNTFAGQLVALRLNVAANPGMGAATIVSDDVLFNGKTVDDLISESQNLIGSSNAGKFVINFNGRDTEITVTAIDVNYAHKQWEYLTGEARQQLLTAHRVTSPMLFGIKDNTGLGNNANEIDVAEEQLMKRVVAPKQRILIDAFEQIAEFYGLVLRLQFKPLTEVKAIPQTSVKFSDAHPVKMLIDLGEDINFDEYYIAAEDEVDYNENIEFASTGTARPNAKSEDDSKDILIRYRYVDQRGKSGADGATGEREFCRQMIRANKLYRKEDILQMGSQLVNPGFGMHPNPNEPYSIWLYKGGGLLSDKYPNGTCKHKWNRVIFLKKGVNVDPNSPLAEIISVSEAKRKGFKVPVNEPMVGLAPHDAKI